MSCKNEHKAIKSSFGLFDGQTNTEYVKKLFGIDKLFSNPKPINLLKYLISVTLPKDNSIILDFFGGSGTTADAIMQLNAEDGGNRKFILCTLDEEVAPTSLLLKKQVMKPLTRFHVSGFVVLLQRFRKNTQSWLASKTLVLKLTKLDSSNFKDVSARPDQFIQGNFLIVYQYQGRTFWTICSSSYVNMGNGIILSD